MSEIDGYPELPEYISERSSRYVDLRVENAAFTVANRISRVGDYEFYKTSWNRLPRPLTNSVRGLADSYFPPRGDEERLRPHPFSYAAERGLIVGIMLADRILKSNVVFGPFCKRMSGEFDSLRKTLPGSPYDLADVLERTGRAFSVRLSERITPPYLTELDVHDDSPIEMQRQSIYADAVGYVGSAALSKLLEQEIKRLQPKDKAAEIMLRTDIDYISAVDVQITAASFLGGRNE